MTYIVGWPQNYPKPLDRMSIMVYFARDLKCPPIGVNAILKKI